MFFISEKKQKNKISRSNKCEMREGIEKRKQKRKKKKTKTEV